MKPATPHRATGYICQLCQFSRSGVLSTLPRTTATFSFLVPTSVRTHSLKVDPSRRSISTSLPRGAGALRLGVDASNRLPSGSSRQPWPRSSSASKIEQTTTSRGLSRKRAPSQASRGGASGRSDPASTIKALEKDGRNITSSAKVPDELEVLEFLEACQKFSQVIIFGKSEVDEVEQKGGRESSNGDNSDGTPASALLDLDEAASGVKGTTVSSSATRLPIEFRKRASDTLSELVYTVLCDPKIYITPEMLHFYVRIQALLGKPEYLPEIFHQYATKPIPKPGSSSPIIYRPAWPRSPKNAIPLELSDAALEAAIAKRDLPLALSIIDTTVCAPAFRTNKVLRNASLPLAAFGVTPVCAYAAATYFANWQNTYDVNVATYMALAGIMAYVGTVSVVGFVAMTTSNDQMERVVWQSGLRLRDRWLREEERLYFDRVAMAWGFKERWKRGEERGEEWDALREFIGRRQMVLDKTALIEGME